MNEEVSVMAEEKAAEVKEDLAEAKEQREEVKEQLEQGGLSEAQETRLHGVLAGLNESITALSAKVDGLTPPAPADPPTAPSPRKEPEPAPDPAPQSTPAAESEEKPKKRGAWWGTRTFE